MINQIVHLSLPLKFFLSLVLGAVIGLERESYEKEVYQKKLGHTGALGVRTFSLITALGAVAGFLRQDYFSLFVTVNVSFMILLTAYYILGSIYTKDHGITTEIAIIFAYLIGVFIALEIFAFQLVLAMTVVLILILSRKEKIKTIIAGIKRSEINAFVSYAIIALVVLPFLPNKSFFLSDIPVLESILKAYGIGLGKLAQVEIFNPFRLWLVVALITGVDIFGYVLERTVGQKKGWLLTSVAGGFISSTATTQSLAQQSKKSKMINLLVAAAIFSSLASFFQMAILIAPLNGMLLVKSTSFLLSIIISALLTGLFFLKFKTGADEENLPETKKRLQEDEIFALGPALKFACLFLLIRVATKTALAFYGDGGFLVTSAISSVVGVDAIVLNLVEMAGKTISFQVAVLALIFVNAVNLFSKAVYSLIQGKREFGLKFTSGVVIIVLASFLGLLSF